MKTRIIAVILAAACAATLAGCFENGLGAKYTATSMLRVSWQQPAIMGQPAHRDTEKEYEIYKKTQQQLVKSRFVLLAALRKPDVAKLPSVQAAQQNGDPVRWLEHHIDVRFPGDAEIMSVSVTRSDPQEAATLDRAVVNAYLCEVVNAERDQKRQRLSELDRWYVEKETELRSKREDINKLTGQLLGTVAEITPPAPMRVDIELMRADVKGLEQVLNEVRLERERVKIEIRATPRVTLLQRADVPESKD